jgi:hypothetical protein
MTFSFHHTLQCETAQGIIDQTMDASWSQYVLEIASVHFKADDNIPHGILMKTPQYLDVELCRNLAT